MAASTSSVVLKSLRKSFGAVDVIKGVDLTIEPGEFCVFVGPSGCGKSTLLRLISGLEEVTSGSIEIGGKDVTHAEPSARGIAMVFQSYALYPLLTVRQNIGFGLSLARLPKAEIAAKVGAAAEALQLTPFPDRKPKALSGGQRQRQRQRVAIGRAIVRDPKVFLFDDPLSNLDAALRAQMRIELSDLHHKLGATMIYVTHDQVEAMTMADKIVVRNGGQIEQVGSPMELYNAPVSPFVAGFIGSPKMNLYDGAVAGMACQTYGVLPEHRRLTAEAPRWTGTCVTLSMMGEELMPSACKVDIMGGLSMYALALASGAPPAILDWNNTYGHEQDLCVCTHCGNFPKSVIGATPEISELDVLGESIGRAKCFGAVKGKVRPHDLFPPVLGRPRRRPEMLSG